MADFLKQITPLELDQMTSDEGQVLRFIAEEKWKQGFTCRKCGNDNYCKGKKPYSRRCTRCKHEESATAHTIFHGCHLPLTHAFRLAFEVCQDPGISTYVLAIPRKIILGLNGIMWCCFRSGPKLIPTVHWRA